MTRENILDALVNWLGVEFSGYSLPNKSGEMQQVKIFAQYMPQPDGITYADKARKGIDGYESADYESNFPCVLVRLGEIIDTEEAAPSHSTVNIQVLTGIYDDTKDCQGYRYILSMQEKVRALLLEHRVIERKYILQMPMKSRLLDLETWPVWYGQQDLVYIAGRPVQNWDYINGGKRH